MKSRENTIQSVIEELSDKGMSDFDIDLFIHVNHQALGGENTNIMNAAQDGNWDGVWNFVDLYFAGDLW